MKLDVTQEVSPEEWDRDVIDMNGTCLHSFKWSQYSSENNNSNVLFFRLKDDFGKVKAVSFGLISEKKILGISLHKTLSFGSLAAAKDTDNIATLTSEIYDYSKNNNIIILSINSFGTPYESEILKKLDFNINKRWEFLLNIGITEDELWKKIHSKKRNTIRKGQKSGLEIIRATEKEQLLQFRQLASDTYNRKTQQGIPYPSAGDVPSYERMQRHLVDSGIGKLYLAFSEGQAVAGAFFVGFNKQVYYMLSSSSDTGLKLAAPDLILWSSITDYQKEGFNLFNFGGLSENELNGSPLEKSGLYHFKKRFSPEVVSCNKGRLIFKPRHYQIFKSIRKIKSLVT